VSNSDELREAIDNGADMLLFANLTSSEVESLAALALEKSSNIVSEYTGNISVENVRRYAEAGVNLISVGSLINMRPVTVEFRMQPA
jgi:nicotinate-nucleotide pyrophosphorylase (carboxylating)